MPQYSVESVMTKGDYRRFLYYAVFFKNPKVVLGCNLIALMAAVLFSFGPGGLDVPRAALYFVAFDFLALGAVAFLTEKSNKNHMGKKTETINYAFYDEKVGIKTEELNTQRKIKYSQIYSLEESKRFLIFFLTNQDALPLKKSCCEDVDGLKAFLKSRVRGYR